MLETADKPGPGRLTTPATTKNDNMGPPPISDDPTTREDHRLALCSDTMPATLVNPRRHDVEWANSISCSVVLYSYSFTGFDPHSIVRLTLIDPHEPLSALAALVRLTHLTIAFSTACSHIPQQLRLSEICPPRVEKITLMGVPVVVVDELPDTCWSLSVIPFPINHLRWAGDLTCGCSALRQRCVSSSLVLGVRCWMTICSATQPFLLVSLSCDFFLVRYSHH